MTTTRRSSIGSILAAATPPGFVRAGVLMPVAPLIVFPLSRLQPMAHVSTFDVRTAVPPVADLEAQALAQFSSWMARRNADIFERALNGTLGRA